MDIFPFQSVQFLVEIPLLFDLLHFQYPLSQRSKKTPLPPVLLTALLMLLSRSKKGMKKKKNKNENHLKRILINE